MVRYDNKPCDDEATWQCHEVVVTGQFALLLSPGRSEAMAQSIFDLAAFSLLFLHHQEGHHVSRHSNTARSHSADEMI